MSNLLEIIWQNEKNINKAILDVRNTFTTEHTVENIESAMRELAPALLYCKEDQKTPVEATMNEAETRIRLMLQKQAKEAIKDLTG